jgi:hypothetical protein
MASQLAREQIQQTIDKLRWKMCPSRVPNAPKVCSETSILTHFATVDKATALECLATAVFTEMPEGFEKQPLGTQYEIPLPSADRDGLTGYLVVFGRGPGFGSLLMPSF